ncbi:hypothetical protein M9Y10_027912 [Tritrichomonas musculus]|uniref:Protein kinase domain-containing protein n=1 Tax=Tritrichomonas musculus TaxID=1915356 RepID=A0ABR2GK22_9EUKA
MIDRDKTMILIDLDRLLNSTKYDENQIVTRDFSHSFIAPEIISNQPFSFSADIYSLGKIIQFIFDTESSFPSEFSKFSEICNQCIQTDPKKRPTIDEIMNKFTSYFLFNDEGNDEVKKRLLSVFDSAFLYDNKEKGIGRALFELGSTHQTMRIPNHLKRNFQYFQNAADLNDIESIMLLGNEYYKSNKINKAIQYYSKASDLKCSIANRKLGDIYFNKTGGYCDLDKAIHYYMKAIQQTRNLHSLLNAAEICFIKHEFKTGVGCFKLAADQNDALSQYNMGVFYLYGIYCVKDVNLGFKYLHLAASQNYSLAQKLLGDLYLQGNLIKRDVQKAIDYYEAAAKQNEIESCYILGVIYYNNFYVPRDINKAIYYFTIAAECDYVKAQYNLGVIYFEGKFVKQDIEKCIYYTSKAAKKNNVEAPLLLGYVYSVPAFGHKDINKAIHYLSISANFGNDMAQVQLGNIYRWGNDVPVDIDKAIFYYQAASHNNNSHAQLELGKIYLYIKEDADKGLFHIQSAANNDNPDAQYHLGILNLNEQLFSSNVNKALYYLELSASKFNIDAQYQLGLLYEEGILVPIDLNKAFYYLTLAANQNHKSAQCHLAFLYLKRNSSNSTINKAIYYFTRSAEQGSKSARFALATFYYEGKHVPRDINKAIDYFKQLSSLNSQFAKNNLGIIYKNGEGVKQNIMMSIEYFNEAIKQENDLVSMFNLAHIYFFEEGVDLDLDIAIYLLINSVKISYSFDLLCLAMVKKYEKITLPDVKNELQVCSHGRFLAIQIYSHIAIRSLLNKASYKESYEYLKNVELVYDIDCNYVLRPNSEKKNEKDDLKKIKDINDLFYEGLGEVVDDPCATDN